MATLDQLLALLPDNISGRIDAGDLRAIVTALYEGDGAAGEALAAALTAGQSAEEALTAAQAAQTVAGNAVPNTPEGRESLAESDELNRQFAGAALRTVSGVAPPVPTDVITTFQPGHGFTNYNSTAASVVDDPAVFAMGSQSLAMTTKADGSQAMVRRTGIPTFDATSKSLAVTVRFEDVSNLTELIIYASSDNFVNYYQWTVQINGPDAQKWLKSSEWQTITLNVGSAVVVGNPNRAALTALQLRARVAAGFSSVVRFNRIALVPDAPAGVISITTDDIYASNWTTMRPILDKFGFGATCYAIPERATDQQVPLDRLHALEDVNGWEVAGHGLTNLTTLSLADAEADLVRSRTWLQRNGFRGVDHYAYPNGGYNRDIERLMRRYYRSGRTIARSTLETLAPANPYRLRAYEPSMAMNLNTVIAQTVTAAASGGWSILLFHDVVTAPTGSQYSTANFEAIMQAIADSGLECKTVGDVLAGR